MIYEKWNKLLKISNECQFKCFNLKKIAKLVTYMLLSNLKQQQEFNKQRKRVSSKQIYFEKYIYIFLNKKVNTDLLKTPQ